MIIIRRLTKSLFQIRYWLIAVLVIEIAIAGHFWVSNTSSTVDSSNHRVSLIQEKIETPGWHSATIGAGGYITGIYIHPQEADLRYIRTDNGGFYRWQTEQQQWQHITHSLPRGFWDYDTNTGGEALALDPQNRELVYIAVGKYTDRAGAIYKSVDRGTTWQQLDLAVPMGGDQDKRWAGNRLVVSPFDSNLLLFGSRLDGLWRSQDAGNSWTQIANLPIANNEFGVLTIAFAPQKENLVYASVYDDGVYQSLDSGITWERLANSPTKVMQMAVARDGMLYATNDWLPQVNKYDGREWSDITPEGPVHTTFNALSLHPEDAKTLLVGEGEIGKAKIYYSEDRGASWTEKKVTLNKTVSWLADESFSDHPAKIAFDPQNPRRVWLTDWFNVWRTDNIQEQTVEWTNQVAGIEQIVLMTMVSPPEGAVLLSGIADQDGFYHHDLNTPPQTRFGFQGRGNYSTLNLTGENFLDNYFQNTHHIAYCQTQPQHLVRVGSQEWRHVYIGVISNDGGLSWATWANTPANKMFTRVAISATNPQNFVVTVSEDRPLVTYDGGSSWVSVGGLPNGEKGPWNWNQPLAADGVKGDRFYYYGEGKVYRSDDEGLSFQVVTRDLPQNTRHNLTTVPGVAEEIWLSLDAGGLYHSQNGGSSFEKIESVKEAHLVTVGTPIGDLLPHSVYVYGTLKDGKSGLFMSVDLGKHWQQINEMEETPKSIKLLVASQQQPGLIFAGTDGRGIQYQLIKASQLEAGDRGIQY